MTAKLHRYDFGSLRDFRGPIQIATAALPIAEEVPPPPPPPTFTEDELAHARIDAKKQGYAEGFTAGLSQAQNEADMHSQNADRALAVIGEQIGSLSATYIEVLKTQSREVSELALLIARKVADEALAANNVDMIVGLVTRSLPVIFSRPRVLVELHPDTLPKAEQRISQLLSDKGFEGELQFRASESLPPHDVRLDWGTGMVERSTAALWQEIQLLIERVPMEMELPQNPPIPTESQESQE